MRPAPIRCLEPELASACRREAKRFCLGVAACSAALVTCCLAVGFWWLAVAGAVTVGVLDWACWRALRHAFQPAQPQSQA